MKKMIALITSLCLLFTCPVYATEITGYKSIYASANADTPYNIEEQYYLTVNKGTGVASATSSQWVNKNSTINVTASPSSGYRITGGTGNYTMDSAKTANVTAEVEKVTITYRSYISKVTINGTTVSSGWSGTIKKGDVIIAYGSAGNNEWAYRDNSSAYFTNYNSSVRCTAPSSSGSGSLEFYYDVNAYDYIVTRRGVCASWTFTGN